MALVDSEPELPTSLPSPVPRESRLGIVSIVLSSMGALMLGAWIPLVILLSVLRSGVPAIARATAVWYFPAFVIFTFLGATLGFAALFAKQRRKTSAKLGLALGFATFLSFLLLMAMGAVFAFIAPRPMGGGE